MARRHLSLAGAVLALGLTLSACGGGGDEAFSSGDGDSDTITLGSANFPESELLMEIYAGALDAKGVATRTQPNIGSREVYLKALEDGSIDLIPEYNGALLAALQSDVPQGTTSPEAVYDALQEVLPEGTRTLTQSAAEDKDSLTVTAATAKKYSLTTMEDLAPVSKDLVVGAGPEFSQRFQGLEGLESVYGIEFKEFKPLDVGGPLTVSALRDGSIDVGNVFTTDSAIETDELVVLEDTKNLYSSQNILPLIRSSKATPEVEKALDAVSAALTTENLTAALAKVQVDKDAPSTVAKQFLADNDLD
ncbi:glycine betaine ABC transporter substrate-binding protein [Solicola sp. PLA-1-18]|uniref:ABC transporter substrate-binding protein n=1 Tax=Solicola sp. PLA-1-18 TaxID=3380532 RepID=UPI003B7D27CC